MPTTMTPSIVELAELCRASYSKAAEVRFSHVTPKSQLTAQGSGFPPKLPSNGPFSHVLPTDHSNGEVCWKLQNYRCNSLGFHAAVYERPGCERVLAFRGSDDLFDFVIDDQQIFFGEMPDQARLAINVARHAGLGSNGYLTGHSLGGALALIVAAHLGLPAVTLSAPGVMDSCLRSVPFSTSVRSFFDTIKRCAVNPRVLNLRIPGDPFSSFLTTGWQAGATRKMLPLPQCNTAANPNAAIATAVLALTQPSLAPLPFFIAESLCRHAIESCIQVLRANPANYSPLSL